jgi:S1-C subfamily serine protease
MDRTALFLAVIFLGAAFGAGGLGGYLAWEHLTQGVALSPITQPEPAYAVLNITGSPEELVSNSYNRVSPSVVHITSTVLRRGFFFDIIPQEGTGSGIIVSEEGYVLTNNHVIQDASKLEVTLSDGSTYDAELVGTDPENDIAVIRLKDPPVGLMPAPLGDSDTLEVGDMVVAIGNPFGLDRTATLGIVSSLNRSIISGEGYPMEGLIQTDASINPGNSGGPLVNSRGEVVGINTAIFSTSGGSIGIGFAIPINKAREAMETIIARHQELISRPWLGITGITITDRLARALNLPVDKGVLVVAVVQGSPAHEAGLEGGEVVVLYRGQYMTIGGDIITEIDGEAVESMEELAGIIASRKAGDEIEITYIRQGRTSKTWATLQARK